jgi:hypothetical protein
LAAAITPYAVQAIAGEGILFAAMHRGRLWAWFLAAVCLAAIGAAVSRELRAAEAAPAVAARAGVAQLRTTRRRPWICRS